ncbi:chemotaxis protein CheB [Glaciimonas sp. Gout2]|uniref:chemotaxis protein CheB n=1 Tax=unclassified Glaciimonas TaxID=2644401 RepID=UPI002B2256AB|nr:MULTISPECIES: chemotaxis protein CheB [unclassified Glaciimonas]MEB0012552.1 chemotaxis protein CheB [Glaciimonas sp. Cout2]MEB0083903.1 chemotaxis protein CheB [Glaciimonas sp. Gout2]
MTRRDIVVIGGSAGSLRGLKILIAGLPSTLPAALLIVTHIPSNMRSFLGEILNRTGSLPAIHPVNGDPVINGYIYLPTAGKHLLVENGRILLSCACKEKFSRPCIDVLFRSAATCYGSRVIGIVLSGALDDGTAGLEVIKKHGGIALVQSLDEAPYRSMPSNAIERVAVDGVMKMADMANAVVQFVQPKLYGTA